MKQDFTRNTKHSCSIASQAHMPGHVLDCRIKLTKDSVGEAKWSARNSHTSHDQNNRIHLMFLFLVSEVWKSRKVYSRVWFKTFMRIYLCLSICFARPLSFPCIRFAHFGNLRFPSTPPQYSSTSLRSIATKPRFHRIDCHRNRASSLSQAQLISTDSTLQLMQDLSQAAGTIKLSKWGWWQWWWLGFQWLWWRWWFWN